MPDPPTGRGPETVTNKWIVTFKTAKQADIVEWALDPMECHHEELYEERPCGGASIEIPKLNGLVMTGGQPETIADLLYRIEVQLQDMRDDEFGRAIPDRAALNAAKLIREVTGVDHDGAGGVVKSLNQEGG